jgi:DNA-binding transcriptional regulator YhcF (GntR family)
VILRIDANSPVPVYEQLRAQISSMVAAGTLAAGTQLPTIRQLATDLGLAKGTVNKAYDELLRAGIATSDGRRGTRIAARTVPADRRMNARELADAADRFAVTIHQLGAADAEARAAIDTALRRIRSSR